MLDITEEKATSAMLENSGVLVRLISNDHRWMGLL
jgi:hypothetical protein